MDFWEEESKTSVSGGSSSGTIFYMGYSTSFSSSRTQAKTSISGSYSPAFNAFYLAYWSCPSTVASSYCFCRWPPGSYVDVTEDVSYLDSSMLVTISGTMSFNFKAYVAEGYWETGDDYEVGSLSSKLTALNSGISAYLLVNGEPVGKALSSGESYSIQLAVSDYANGISSLGWRFINNSSSAIDSSCSTTFDSYQGWSLYLYYVDDSVDIVTEVSEVGLLQSILQWLANIKDSIVSLPSRIADFVISGIRGLFDDEFAAAEEDAQDFSAVGDELANYGFAEFDGNRTESELQLLFGDNPFMKVVGYVICIGFVGMILKKAVG